MGRILALKTYSKKCSKYKTKQLVSVKNRDLYISVINGFHSTSQDTFEKLLKKDKIDKDSASITQPVCIRQISDNSRHFFTNGFEFMKNKKCKKNSETESSSSVLFKDPYSLVHLGKRRRTKKKVKERNATCKVKRKVLTNRKPLKKIKNASLRNEDKSIIKYTMSSNLTLEDLQLNLRSKGKKRQSEMKCVTYSSTPLIGEKLPNHVWCFSPIRDVKKTLFHDEVKNEKLLTEIVNDCLSRKSKMEIFPYFIPSESRQETNKTYSVEESNFAQQKLNTEEKSGMNQEESVSESKTNQQINSPDFFTCFLEDKTDSIQSECCSTSNKKVCNVEQDEIDLADVSELDINKQLKQLTLSDSDREFSHDLFEDKVEKENSKDHIEPSQIQTFGNNNNVDLINKDHIFAENQEVYKEQSSGNDQEHIATSYKTFECENSEWKTVKYNHEISINQCETVESMELKEDVKKNREDVTDHITDIEDVDVNELTENHINDREQDSYIILQPGKQWRRSLLIHRRNRRSLSNVRGEDCCSRFSINPEQIVKVALNMKYSIDTRDSSSDFMNENVGKVWKCDKFNLKSCIIKEEDETDESVGSAVPTSSRFILSESDDSVCDENTTPDYSQNKWRKSFSFNNESGFRGFSSKIINTDTASTYGMHNERGFGTDSVHADVLECNGVQPVDVEKVILDICEQDRVITFDEFFCGRDQEECRKLGEGTYAEVFLLHGEDESVLKIIPVEGGVIVNGENQKTFLEIFSEMIISKQLSKLRYGMENNTKNFCYMKHIWCLQGRYPDRLKELWEIYNEKNGSDNDSPEIFENDQKYIALELNNGGIPLLSFSFSSARQAFSVFLQTVFALAVAENSCEFEHRDLHTGNLLITRCKSKQIHCKIDSVDFNIPTCGVQATIIDYTLSRINCNGTVLFNDLSKDPEMFQGVGDYQFDIYRIMREDLNSDWSEYAPITNIRWLHYLLDKILQKGKFSNSNSKVHKNFIKQLERIYDLVQDF